MKKGGFAPDGFLPLRRVFVSSREKTPYPGGIKGPTPERLVGNPICAEAKKGERFKIERAGDAALCRAKKGGGRSL